MIRPLIMRPHIIKANTFTILLVALLLVLGFNVALPTETVYGLFAVYWNANAIDGIYEIKKRNRENPVIVHCSCHQDVVRYDLTRMTKYERVIFEALAEQVWPGPCTMVVRANTQEVLSSIRNATEFVGIRVPDEVSTRRVLKIAGPCVGPSANPSGRYSPTKAKDVEKDYQTSSFFIPILKSNGCSKFHGIESTIIKIYETDPCTVVIKIMRAGAIGPEQIREILENHTFDFQYRIDVNTAEVNNHTADAPGQEITHYAPETNTLIGTNKPNANPSVKRDTAVLIATEQITSKYGANYHKCFVMPSNDEEYAEVLYTTMREADTYCKTHHCKDIVMCTDGLIARNVKSGYTAAIHDKLFRASSGRLPVLL